MTDSGEPVQLLGGNVTANYFELLGIHPILGRNFLPEEESKARRRDGDGKILAGTFQTRSECAWPQHYARRGAATRSLAFCRISGYVVRGEPDRGSLADETISDSGITSMSK